jgi:hypothetical protein
MNLKEEETMARVYRLCRQCGETDPTVAKREGLTVLCASCHIDLKRLSEASSFSLDATDGAGSVEGFTRVWTPRETGVLKWNPFKPVVLGGGR